MGRPTTLPQPWRKLAGKCGGVSWFAWELQVWRKSLLRYAWGERIICARVRKRLLALATKFDLKEEFLTSLKRLSQTRRDELDQQKRSERLERLIEDLSRRDTGNDGLHDSGE